MIEPYIYEKEILCFLYEKDWRYLQYYPRLLDGHEKHTDLNYRTIASLAGNLFAGCSACFCVAVQYLKDLGATKPQTC